jgi:hypothetical protein
MPAETRPQTWIHQFARRKPKPANYAEKTLTAYRLGMKAKGAIVGVRILVSEASCQVCRAMADQVYTPDTAPRLPHADCTHPEGCRCAYTPVMRSHERLTALINAAGPDEPAANTPPADETRDHDRSPAS